MKKFVTFSQKRVFLIFWENRTLIFWEIKLSNLKFKKFQEGNFQAQKIKRIHSEKISYILRNGTF